MTGVVHLAGFKYAGVSVDRPLHTYEQNVEGTRRLLLAMHRANVHQMVFSSSAAVFGTPDVDLVTEDTPTLPESPYGESKLIGEWLLRDVAKVIPLRHTSLRYFNVVGPPTTTSTTPARTTWCRWCSRPSPRAARPASTATTTRRPTAPASATTCMWATSPTRTWRRRRRSPRAASSSPSTTSAAATA